jgi:hypothetical protein
MKTKVLLTTAALAAIFVLAVPASAADVFFRPSSSANWSDDDAENSYAASVWWDAETGGSQRARPANGDVAIILSGKRCDVDVTTARADAFDVRGTGVLSIDAGMALEIDTDANSSVAGQALYGYGVFLEGDDSELRISGTGSMQISGGGSICGEHNNAMFNISSTATVTLVSGTAIEGALEIRAGSGTFDNDGLVKADYVSASSYKITLYNGTFAGGSGIYQVPVDASGDPEIEIYNYNDTVYPTTTGMSANFLVEDGTLDVNKTVTTTGGLQQTGGVIDVKSGESFTASGAYPT